MSVGVVNFAELGVEVRYDSALGTLAMRTKRRPEAPRHTRGLVARLVITCLVETGDSRTAFLAGDPRGLVAGVERGAQALLGGQSWTVDSDSVPVLWNVLKRAGGVVK